MLSILVICIITISFVGISSMAIQQTIMTQTLANQAFQNSNELLTIKKALILSGKFDLVYGAVLPYGVNTGSYHKIPEFVYLKTKNAFNKDYIYCPFAASQTTLNKEVELTESINYSVDTMNISNKGTQREYVVSSHSSQFQELGVRAIIISPTPPFNNLPSCLDVIYNADLQKFIVEGGRVEVITATNIEIGI